MENRERNVQIIIRVTEEERHTAQLQKIRERLFVPYACYCLRREP